MSLRDDLAGVLARDPRYPIQAYAFVFEALELTKTLKKRSQARSRARLKPAPNSHHVDGRELCEGARRLALRDYGLMAMSVLSLWGIRSTSDIGEIVYNLIASGDLEKTPSDSRTDFDNVFDFETALKRNYVLALDEVA
ncbi:Minf_1886 family protein [Singulisphaera sp. PoT]|uniref:Minf_1886 family protein n=1 Tax=Singulisphaera sp. PoT TaxID=3411797 RepID=UPI003BF5F322